MKTVRFFGKGMAVVAMAGLLAACNNDSDVASKGTASIAITDAAVDAEAITGVMLSVKEVQARGNGSAKTVAVFDTPKTFNLMDYQNGETYALGEGEIDAGIYNELRLVLDESSHVEFEDGSTEPLQLPSGMASGYKIMGDYQIDANGRSNMVVDVDLRKALVKTGNGQYILRPTARLVNSATTGIIRGTVNAHSEDRVVIYAYAKGTWNEAEAETPADGHSRFEGSVNSAVVANGQFTLAFMEPGEYDLIAVAYERDTANDTFVFKSATQAEVSVAGSILSILKLEANATMNVLVSFGF